MRTISLRSSPPTLRQPKEVREGARPRCSQSVGAWFGFGFGFGVGTGVRVRVRIRVSSQGKGKWPKSRCLLPAQSPRRLVDLHPQPHGRQVIGPQLELRDAQPAAAQLTRAQHPTSRVRQAAAPRRAGAGARRGRGPRRRGPRRRRRRRHRLRRRRRRRTRRPRALRARLGPGRATRTQPGRRRPGRDGAARLLGGGFLGGSQRAGGALLQALGDTLLDVDLPRLHGSKAVESAELEVASPGIRGSGGAPGGPASPLGRCTSPRATRRAPRRLKGRAGHCQGGTHFDYAATQLAPQPPWSGAFPSRTRG
jgi:hypothetical protein